MGPIDKLQPGTSGTRLTMSLHQFSADSCVCLCVRARTLRIGERLILCAECVCERECLNEQT